MADFLALAATTAGVAMAMSPILQIRRMLVTHSSTDFSIGYMSVLLTGFAVWVAYGVSISNAALMISNSVSFAFGVLTIVIALRLRRTGPAAFLAATRPEDLRQLDGQ